MPGFYTALLVLILLLLTVLVGLLLRRQRRYRGAGGRAPYVRPRGRDQRVQESDLHGPPTSGIANFGD